MARDYALHFIYTVNFSFDLFKRKWRIIAHQTQITGRHSELLATTALVANGYEVAEPVVDEPYDLLIRKTDEETNWNRVQVKTCRVREDRGNSVVIYAKKNNGNPYTRADCDLLIGVEGENVYIFPCEGHGEYWATESGVGEKWTKLKLKI